MSKTQPAAVSSSTASAPTKAGTRIIFVSGDKGGIGKSFVAKALVNYLITQGSKVAALESDTRNGDLNRMFAAIPDVNIGQCNLSIEAGWMSMIDYFYSNLGKVIVVNTPAGVGGYMEKWMPFFKKFIVSTIAETDNQISIELLWVMNLDHDTLNLLDKADKTYGQYFNHTRVICNLHYSLDEIEPFSFWLEHELCKKYEKASGKTMFFPALHRQPLKKIFEGDPVLPFSEAVSFDQIAITKLTQSERMKLIYWYDAMRLCFDPVYGTAASA